MLSNKKRLRRCFKKHFHAIIAGLTLRTGKGKANGLKKGIQAPNLETKGHQIEIRQQSFRAIVAFTVGNVCGSSRQSEGA